MSADALQARGIVIKSVPHAPYRITHHGRPARLAIVDEETGAVIDASPAVARECCALSMQMLQSVWQGQGWVVAINTPEAMDQAA
jgi:hypothetical protein